MGMFDSFYDAKGNEWQTKAFGRSLRRWGLGDEIPGAAPIDFQVEVFGGPRYGSSEDALATLSEGRVVAVPDQRHYGLPLLDYNGAWKKQARSSSEETK